MPARSASNKIAYGFSLEDKPSPGLPKVDGKIAYSFSLEPEVPSILDKIGAAATPVLENIGTAAAQSFVESQRMGEQLPGVAEAVEDIAKSIIPTLPDPIQPARQGGIVDPGAIINPPATTQISALPSEVEKRSISLPQFEALDEKEKILSFTKKPAAGTALLISQSIKGFLQPYLPALKEVGINTQDILDTAIEFYQKEAGRGRDIPVIGNLGDVAQHFSEMFGWMAPGGPASIAFQSGRALASRVPARPIFRQILSGIIAGGLLGEGKKDKTLSNAALFGLFEPIAGWRETYNLIVQSRTWKNWPVKYRVPAVQTLQETLQKNPDLKPADVLRMWDNPTWRAEVQRVHDIRTMPGKPIIPEPIIDLTDPIQPFTVRPVTPPAGEIPQLKPSLVPKRADIPTLKDITERSTPAPIAGFEAGKEPVFGPEKRIETVDIAAIRLANGKVVVGEIHADALGDLTPEEQKMDFEEGFLTSKDRFISRNEAKGLFGSDDSNEVIGKALDVEFITAPPGAVKKGRPPFAGQRRITEPQKRLPAPVPGQLPPPSRKVGPAGPGQFQQEKIRGKLPKPAETVIEMGERPLNADEFSMVRAVRKYKNAKNFEKWLSDKDVSGMHPGVQNSIKAKYRELFDKELVVEAPRPAVPEKVEVSKGKGQWIKAYHGTPDGEIKGDLVYFADKPEVAEIFAESPISGKVGRVIEADIKIDNPYYAEGSQFIENAAYHPELTEPLKKQGYDGIIFENKETGHTEYLVFENKQIRPKESPRAQKQRPVVPKKAEKVLTHLMPDGTVMPGPVHEGAVPGSEALREKPTVPKTEQRKIAEETEKIAAKEGIPVSEALEKAVEKPPIVAKKVTPESLAKEFGIEFIGESDGVSTFRRVVDGKETTTLVRGDVTRESLESAISVQDKELAEFKEKFPKREPEAKPESVEGKEPETEGVTKAEKINPNELIFTEEEQSQIDIVKERFLPEDLPPITVIDGKTVIDGHNRASVAIEAGVDIKTISIKKDLFDRLRKEGFDEAEISYAMLVDAKEFEASDLIGNQFPGSDIVNRGNKILEIFDAETARVELGGKIPPRPQISGKAAPVAPEPTIPKEPAPKKAVVPTKKQKALSEYKEYIESLTDDQRAKAGDLIVDEPEQPLTQKFNILKALSDEPGKKKLLVPSRADADKKRVSGKLRKIAESTKAKAQEKHDQDRNENTPKRAREAASARADAAHDIAIAETMLKIADGLEFGELKALSGVSAKTHVEMLDRILVRAQYQRYNKEGLSYGEQQQRKGEPITIEDVKYAEYPDIYIPEGTQRSVRRDIEEVRGGKKIMAGVRGNYLDFDTAKTLLNFAKKHKIRLVGTIDSDVAEVSRMRQLGIKDIEQLREALTELVEIRSGAKKEDPVKAMERELLGTKIPGFFPTRQPVVDRMIKEAGLEEGMAVLEPSAGIGNIAEGIQAAGFEPDVVEVSNTLRQLLEAKGFSLVGDDFLKFEGEYDRIIMNPPFEKFQDIDHVRYAYELLKPGGRIVSIMGEGTFFRTDKKAQEFRDWLDDVGWSEKLPEGAFKGRDALRETGVASRLVVIDKPSEKLTLVPKKAEAVVEPKAPPKEAKAPEKAISKLKDESGFITLEGDSPVVNAIDDLIAVSQRIYNDGNKTFNTFRDRLKRMFRGVWDRIKHLAKQLYEGAKQINEAVGTRGSASIKPTGKTVTVQKGKKKAVVPPRKFRKAAESIKDQIVVGDVTVGKENILEIKWRTMRASLKTAKAQGKKLGKFEEHVLATEKADAKKLKAYMKELARKITKPVPASVDFYYKEAIETLQAGVDPNFRSPNTLIKRNQTKQMLQGLPDELRDMLPTELMAELSKKPLNNYTIPELEEIYEQIKTLKEVGRLVLKEKRAKEQRDVDMASVAIVNRLTKGKGPIIDPWVKAVKGDKKSFLKRAYEFERAYSLTGPRIFDRIDRGGEFKQVAHEIFYNWTAQREDVAKRASLDSFGEFGNELKRLDIKGRDFRKSYEYESEGVKRSFTGQQLAFVYAGWKNPETRAALQFGEGISETVYDKMMEDLPESLKKMADWIQNDFEAHWLELRRAKIDLDNEDMGHVRAYVPMRRYGEALGKFEEELGKEMAERAGLRKSNVGKGFTIERVNLKPEHQTRLNLNLVNLWYDQVEKRNRLIHLGKHIRFLHKIENNKDFREAVIQKFSKTFYDAVINFTNSVANPEFYKTFNVAEEVSREIRGNVAIAYLAYNASVILKQIPSVAFYIAEANPYYFTRAVMEAIANPAELKRFVESRDIRIKESSVEREIEEFKRTSPQMYRRFRSAVGTKGMLGIVIMDKTVKAVGWKSVYNRGIGIGMDDAEATKYARNVTSRQQPSFIARDLSMMFKTNEFLNWFTQFGNQLNKIYNTMTHDIPMEAKNKHFIRAFSKLTAVALAGIAIWTITNRRAPESPEEVAQAIGENALSAVPGIGRALVSMFRGYGASFPPAKIGEGIVSLVKGQKGKKDAAWEAFSIAFGAPYTGPKRLLKIAQTEDISHIIGGPPRRKKVTLPKGLPSLKFTRPRPPTLIRR